MANNETKLIKTQKSKYEKDLEKLLKIGGELERYYSNSVDKTKKQEQKREEWTKFFVGYQAWYSESLALLKIILPDRLAEFKSLYEKNINRKEITLSNYVIEDALDGFVVKCGTDLICSPINAFIKFQRQFLILSSAKRVFLSSLFSLKAMLQADLFDNDIEAANNLNKNGFHRAAGAMCGVVIERHLNDVCANHNLSLNKKEPTINDFNDLLKGNNIYDISAFRKIQYLGDIRNKCDHNKQIEPTKEEVKELIDGTSWLIKNIF